MGFALQVVKTECAPSGTLPPAWSLRALRGLMRAVFALQAGPHPGLCFILTCVLGYVTLLEETPRDTAYNTKRYSACPAVGEVCTPQGSGLGSTFGPSAWPSPGTITWLQGGLGFRSASVGRRLGGPTLQHPRPHLSVWQVGSVPMCCPPGQRQATWPQVFTAPPGCTRPLRPHCKCCCRLMLLRGSVAC